MTQVRSNLIIAIRSGETTLGIGRCYKKEDPYCDARGLLTGGHELS